MKNKTPKLILAGASFLFYVAAVVMFAFSFLDQKTSSILGGGKGSWATGFELAFTPKDLGLESKDGLGTLFAFILVVVGVLAACYAVFFVLTAKKSKKAKGTKNAKLICAACTFVLCSLVPALLIFLTSQTTGIAFNASGILGKTETTLGVGAILAAVFSLVGGCALSIEEVL